MWVIVGISLFTVAVSAVGSELRRRHVGTRLGRLVACWR